MATLPVHKPWCDWVCCGCNACITKELISTLSAGGKWIVRFSPPNFASKEKATTACLTPDIWTSLWMERASSLFHWGWRACHTSAKLVSCVERFPDSGKVKEGKYFFFLKEGKYFFPKMKSKSFLSKGFPFDKCFHSSDPATFTSPWGWPNLAELRGADSVGGSHRGHQDHAAWLGFQGNRKLSPSATAGSMAGKHRSHQTSAGKCQTSVIRRLVMNVKHQSLEMSVGQSNIRIIRHLLVNIQHESHRMPAGEHQSSGSSGIHQTSKSSDLC